MSDELAALLMRRWFDLAMSKGLMEWTYKGKVMPSIEKHERLVNRESRKTCVTAISLERTEPKRRVKRLIS